MSNIEQQFISCIIETGDFKTVSENQITPRYLKGKNKVAFRYIQRFLLKYGKVPSREVFEKKMANFELVECSEGMEYYCDEVRNKSRHNKLVEAVEVATDKIGELETEEALKIIRTTITEIDNDFSKTDRVDLTKNTMSRLEEYKQRAISGGITGIPTGIDKLDKILGGFNDEELIILIAFTGMGKRKF